MDRYEDIIARLANHACLSFHPDDEEELNKRSLLHQFWLVDRGGVTPDLQSLLDDVLKCLSALNIYLNGPDPNTREGARSAIVPDAISYPVACILTGCLEYYRKWTEKRIINENALTQLLVGTHKIAYCWAQFLASDMTDLAEGFE